MNQLRIFSLIWLFLAPLGLPAVEYHVSPAGDDRQSGSVAEPFRSIARAVSAVRDWRQVNNKDTPARILLREGRHQLEETLVLDFRDGEPSLLNVPPRKVPGAAEPEKAPLLTIAAFPGETPVISGAVPVDGWKPLEANRRVAVEAEGKIWVADIPKKVGHFRSLFDASGLLKRARCDGFNPTREGTLRELHFPVGALRDWANLPDVEILVRPKNPWTINLLPVEAVDTAAGVARTAVSATYNMDPLRKGTHDRYGVSVWVENVLEALNEPGEWVVDTHEGKVYLWPRETDEAGRPTGVLAPVLTELVRVEGRIDYAGPTDLPVTGISFEGITFSHGDRYAWTSDEERLGWGLQHDWEMFDRPTALVRFRGVESCSLENCRFVNSGGTGLRLDLHAQNNRIAGNRFEDLGGVGVLLAGYGFGTKDLNRNNTVIHNRFHDFGKILWHSVGIWAWQSGYNHIAHNIVEDCPYSGILVTGRIRPDMALDDEGGRTVRRNEVPESLVTTGRDYDGWIGKEPYMHGRHNLIEYNRLSRTVQTLSDGNAIYISGAGTGNCVRYNLLVDNGAPTVTETIRCDDDQHETLVYGNLIEGSGGLSTLSSKGRNYFINNFILKPTQPNHRAYISFERYPIRDAVVRQNVIVSHPSGGLISAYTKQGADRFTMLKEMVFDENLYFNTAGGDWADSYLDEMRSAGLETLSRVVDPQFVDYENGDYELLPASPAYEMGIEPLYPLLREIGRKGFREYASDHRLAYGQNSVTLSRPKSGSAPKLVITTVTGETVVETRLPDSDRVSFDIRDLEFGWYLATVSEGETEIRTQFYHH